MKFYLDELQGEALIRNNERVEDFRRQFNTIMRNKGFVVKRSLQSALVHLEYTKGIRRITISGWHGTGKPGTCRHFGDTKTFFCLNDTDRGRWAAVEYDVLGQNSWTLEQAIKAHNDAMDAALEYIRAL